MCKRQANIWRYLKLKFHMKDNIYCDFNMNTQNL